jgi:hypothetical protein
MEQHIFMFALIVEGITEKYSNAVYSVTEINPQLKHLFH